MFRLDTAATVTFVFVGGNGHRRATLKASGHSGANAVRLPRRLRAGRYAVVVSARDLARNTATPVVKTIRLRRR
jgi:hypothetical protein